MSYYKKCSEVQCEWHMGHNHIRFSYLNGKCYHNDAEESMFCPKNLNGKAVKLVNECLGCNETKELLPGGYCAQCDWENANDIHE